MPLRISRSLPADEQDCSGSGDRFPVHVGSGHVHCAHGILPVPAPATAYILNGVPMYGGAVKGELCTPTGAALLKHFATRFGDMPVMRTETIGYGMGKKDFEQANCIRAMLGETEDAGDSVLQLECNVDDMTAEELGFAMETILEAGALEVYTVAAGMKKSRPGTILCVLCHEDAKETLVRVIFRNTTTIGVREHRCSRYTLKRSFETVQTPYGDVQKKLSSGYGVTREKYEYEDLARIAREQGCLWQRCAKVSDIKQGCVRSSRETKSGSNVNGKLVNS